MTQNYLKKIYLIGLGAIGIPIADLLYNNPNSFRVLISGPRKEKFLSSSYYINNKSFKPSVVLQSDDSPFLLIVCVKNYDLHSTLSDIRNCIDNKTIILPLQNGIYATDFYKKYFPNNVVLSGFVQGPNTEKNGTEYFYSNPGQIHIGSDNPNWTQYAESVVELLNDANITAFYEPNIKISVWKKWMLNVAGNSITALTGADYSIFKYYNDLQIICRHAMQEFLKIAHAENVPLTENDIEDIMNYYIFYRGAKKTSMLMDVINEKKTENDYLSGKALELAKKHHIDVPTISSLYYLMEIKEEVYMDRKGLRTMKNLFTEGVQYSEELKEAMTDIATKMSDSDYAHIINSGDEPEQLKKILKYATENTKYYSYLKDKDNLCLADFPVMNKTILNENYDDFLVHYYDDKKTHKMFTSGSTGIPFTVVQNMPKRTRNIADLKYFGARAGYADHDPMCFLRAMPTATLEEQKRDNIWQLDIQNLSEDNLTDYFHVMVEKKCTALIAYPSTLETAVDFWSKNFENISYIKTIISVSEALTDSVKEKLHSYFGDEVQIHARYSNTENGVLGQETDTSGYFFLNWASYYFEILKLESDEPAEEGELGRIIVTDLYNLAFPMIRYDTGDVAKFYWETKNSLPGFTELYGRRMDLIYDTKGEVVSPFLLCRTMRLTNGIEQWQFIQENEKEYILRITANSSEKPNVDKEVAHFIETLGEDATINVEYVENIPVMNSLKRKLIVSNLKK